jgi:hypothetical protein
VSRNDRIIAEARKGHRPAVIAGLVGCRPSVVYETLCRARKRGIDVPRFPSGPVPGPLSATVRVSRRTRRALELQAMTRGGNAHELAEAMLSRLATSPRLIAAVLGDPVTPKGD